MLFAGFNVADGEYSLSGSPPSASPPTSSAPGSPTRSATSAASTCSRSTARKLTSSRHHLQKADHWFERYGDATVFFSRMLPIVRTFISLPAGVARMPFWRFTVFTVARLHPVGLRCSRFIGKQAGDNWEQLEGAPALRRLRRGRGDRARASPGCSCARRRRAPCAAAVDAADLAETVALGLIQGAAELLPVSSSAHVARCPWLLGWRPRRAARRRAQGARGRAARRDRAAPLVAAGRGPRAPLACGALALSLAPPAVAATLLERAIERRLGGPGAVAAGLLPARSRMAGRRRPRRRVAREPADATPSRRAVARACAQAAALVPGVSRSGRDARRRPGARLRPARGVAALSRGSRCRCWPARPR